MVATSILDKLSSAEKRNLFTAIAKDLVSESGTNTITLTENDELIGCCILYNSKAEIISPDEQSPYLDEFRECAKTADQSIPLEEFIKKFESDPEP